jgi:hypothetical protein
LVAPGSSQGDAEGGQGSARVAGVVAQGGGEVARPAERADGQVAQAGHHVRAGAGADLPGVLGEGGVADIMQAVLDRPVPPGMRSASRAGWPGEGRLVIASTVTVRQRRV